MLSCERVTRQHRLKNDHSTYGRSSVVRAVTSASIHSVTKACLRCAYIPELYQHSAYYDKDTHIWSSRQSNDVGWLATTTTFQDARIEELHRSFWVCITSKPDGPQATRRRKKDARSASDRATQTDPKAGCRLWILNCKLKSSYETSQKSHHYAKAVPS